MTQRRSTLDLSPPVPMAPAASSPLPPTPEERERWERAERARFGNHRFSVDLPPSVVVQIREEAHRRGITIRALMMAILAASGFEEI